MILVRADEEAEEELADLKRKYEGLLDEHAARTTWVDQSTASQ
jgi:hypothetical protein